MPEGCAGPFRDESDFVAFHRDTARRLWSYLHYLCRDPALADELTQESYLRLLQAAGRLDEGPGLQGYLYRIAHRLFVDHTRRRTLERTWMPISHSSPDFLEGDGEPQRAPARETDARVECENALAGLTAREQTLLWLAYGEGAGHREIAARTGVREKSVRVLLLRARRRVLALLGGERSGRR